MSSAGWVTAACAVLHCCNIVLKLNKPPTGYLQTLTERAVAGDTLVYCNECNECNEPAAPIGPVHDQQPSSWLDKE